MGLLELTLATGMVLVGGLGLTWWMRPVLAGETLLTALVLGCCGIVLDTVVVGALLRSYRPVPLLLGALAYGLLGMGAATWSTRRSPAARRVPLRLLRTACRHSLRRAGAHPVVMLSLVAVAVVYSIRGWFGVTFPPTDFDSLMYHLVAPDVWTQTGHVGHVTENIWSDAYPMGVESLLGWPIVFLHTVQYSALALLPAYLLAAVAIGCIARRLGARAPHAALAGAVFLLTPAAFVQAGTPAVDAVTAGYGAAVIATVGHLRSAVRVGAPGHAVLLRRLVVLGAVLGLAAGSKSSNLVVVGLAVLATGWHLWRMRTPARTALLGGAALVAVATAVGGFWYVRTWMTYGSPFYPVRMFGFSGRGSASDLLLVPTLDTPPELKPHAVPVRILISWWDAFSMHGMAYSIDYTTSLLGIAWIVFVLPAALVGMVCWARRRPRLGSGLLAGVVAVAVFVASPAPWLPRYELPAVAAVLPFAAFALTRLSLAGSARRIAVGPVAGSRVPVGRVASLAAQLGVAVCVAVSAVWGLQYVRLMVPTLYPSSRATGSLPLMDAVDFARNPDRAKLMEPWLSYRGVRRVPAGETISLVIPQDYEMVQPFVGVHLERGVVELATPTSSAQLADEMRRAGSRYVMIANDPQVEPLLIDAMTDQDHFRRVFLLRGRGTILRLTDGPPVSLATS